MKQYSRVCERVNLDAIFYNFQMMKANIKDGVQMIAVIKTDGYGHGAVQIARLLEPVDYIWGYAVATLDEAVVLRKNEIKKLAESRRKTGFGDGGKLNLGTEEKNSFYIYNFLTL